jgi:hypothetical protein
MFLNGKSNQCWKYLMHICNNLFVLREHLDKFENKLMSIKYSEYIYI